MLLAPDCRCAEGPREFDPGWCHRCGHLLDPVIAPGEELDGWIRLLATVERERMRMASGMNLSLEDYAARVLV